MSGDIDLKRILKAVASSETIVTPRLNQYLLSGRYDEALPQWIVDFIDNELTKPRYSAKGRFRASSAGSCERYQHLRYLGVTSDKPIDPRLANIFSDGKWRHLRWQAMLLHSGILLRPEEGLDWPARRAWATMDGIGIVPDNHPKTAWRGKEFGFELKGANPFGYKQDVKVNDEAKETHLDQVHRAFLAGGFDLYVMIYENKSNQEWHEWVFEPDQERLASQSAELDRLNAGVTEQRLAKMLPDCAARTGYTFHHGCPFGTRTGACVRAKIGWPDERRVRELSERSK